MYKKLLCGLLALLLSGCTAAGVPETQTAPVSVPEPTAAASEIKPQPETEPPTEPPTEPETEAPTEPTQAETEDPAEAALAAQLAAMTTEEKAAQLFFVTPEALTGAGSPVTEAGETTREAFGRCPVGGILCMGQNLVSPEQTKQLLADMEQISLQRLGLPVFLGVDEEGGTVARISGSGRFGVGPYPDMASLGGDTDRAGQIGSELGASLHELGFNVDFAPVADVWTNPENEVVRYRAFSSDPETVRAMCAAFSDGLQAQGVLACYKHFPGHGATSEDSHEGCATSHQTAQGLRSCELLPFADAVRREIPFIMVGHISLPQAVGDGLPASLSPTVVTGILREELGYEGLVITDALNMGAITRDRTPGEAAVEAILAGDDMLLMGDGLAEAYEAVLAAVEDGTIPLRRLDEAVLRILRCKSGL